MRGDRGVRNASIVESMVSKARSCGSCGASSEPAIVMALGEQSSGQERRRYRDVSKVPDG